MKLLSVVTVAGVVMMSGCAGPRPDGQSVTMEESYAPTGTLIPRKNPNRADMPSIPDKQALENDRTMGAANQDGVNR